MTNEQKKSILKNLLNIVLWYSLFGVVVKKFTGTVNVRLTLLKGSHVRVFCHKSDFFCFVVVMLQKISEVKNT